MSAPVLRGMAADVYEDLEPLAREDDQHGYALAHLVAALCAPVEDLWDWTLETDDTPAMGAFLDPDRCPAFAVPWLGQFRGVRIPAGTPDAVARQRVKDAAGFERGKTSAIVAAAQTTLTGTRTVNVTERPSGDAWKLTVRTRTSETPDSAATLAAMLAVKPGGITLTHVVSDAPLIDEGTRVIDSTTATIDAATTADVT